MGSHMIPVPPAGGAGANPPYFPLLQQQSQLSFHAQLDGDDGGMGGGDDDGTTFLLEQPPAAASESDAHFFHGALLYNLLSVLRDKVRQLEPLVGLAVARDGGGPVAGAASSGASAVVQEIISAASSMMYAFQQLCHASQQQQVVCAGQQQAAVVDHAVTTMQEQQQQRQKQQHQHGHGGCGKTAAAASSSTAATEEEAAIIELDAAELLAKYTHYCQVCGKGFKRDANLRMHMRAHGDEYKSSAALLATRPAASNLLAASASAGGASAGGGDAAGTTTATARGRSYYSCPQEGCRWNRRHARFQPLKSVTCAKNHYKRSHCPKMYVCNRCSLKRFSVLSDLRTHEKHCGDDHRRWLCSCGTSFSRKDKLVGHLDLFAAGHHPAVPLARH